MNRALTGTDIISCPRKSFWLLPKKKESFFTCLIMRLLTAILIILSALQATAQDTTYFNSKWELCDKSESEYYRIQTKNGKMWTRTDFWSGNGQIQMQGKLSSLDPEVKEGYYEWYHKNGHIKHKGNYLDGKEVGEHLWYYENGKLEAKENWLDGIMNGGFEEYYSNGYLSTQSGFVNGLQNGKTIYFREDASKHSEGDFLNGNRDGEWKYFSESGELLGTTFFKTEYTFEEGGIFLKLPNDNWSLANQTSQGISQYTFKRKEIVDPEGNKIVPAIMLYIEDASKFNEDVTMFSIQKQQQFAKAGIKIDRILVQDNKDYPLTHKNGYFVKCSYNSNGLDHLFYMIHLITKEGKGIQLYLDMTTNIAEEYEQEFWTTIKSLRVL